MSNDNTQTCKWQEDDDGNWHTACDRDMCFEYGPPHEHGYKFCMECGKPIELHQYQPTEDFEP